MALTPVQVSPTVHLTAAGVITATLGTATTAGNTLVACINANGSTGNPVATAATLGGSADHWSQVIANNPAVESDAQIWFDPNCAGGQTSVAVTFGTAGSGTIDEYLTVYEVPGVLIADKTVTVNGGASSTWSSGATGTTVQADEIFFGALVSSSTTLPVATGVGTWTTQGSTGARWQLAGYQVVAATGTATYSGTSAASAHYSVAVATFRAVAAAAATTDAMGVAPGFSSPSAFLHPVALARRQGIDATIAVTAAVAPAGVATAAAAAANPVPAVTVSAGAAAVSALSAQPTVSTVPAVNAPAGFAAVAAVAGPPIPAVGAKSAAAVSAAAAASAVPSVAANTTPATGNATAPAASVVDGTGWLYAGTAAAVSGTWATTANAVGSTTGNYATWAPPGAGTSATLELASFGLQAAVPVGATVGDVTVRVRHSEPPATGFSAVAAQVYLATTPYGSPHALTVSDTVIEEDITVTGLTRADLADLRLQVTATSV